VTQPDIAPPPTAGQNPQEQPWYAIIVPLPRKGMKRNDYLNSPDTIGSLWEARHGDDEESQICRQRLWGLVNHYEAKGWVKRDGTQMPPNQVDIEFRKWLDVFAEFFAKNHPDEKL
jgi:hypothetical protein